MIEDIEGLEYSPKRCSEGLTDQQTKYLSELNASPNEWADRDDIQQWITASAIDARMEELGVPVDQRSELAYEVFIGDMADVYDDFIADNYDSNECVFKNQLLEAPQDYIQIEQISDVLTNCEELNYDNWISLELLEKENVLNTLEERIAEIEHRPACHIHLAELEDRCWGGYNPESKDITINSQYAEKSDYRTYCEIIDTLVHEGRHAYQDYNVNVTEIHPRHSEVATWAETMEGGKWGYWGDCSTLMGQRLYEQQSIEIDARNFAGDVMDKLNLNA